MTAILFKTEKLAKEYIATTYPQVTAGKYTTNDITIDDRCRVTAVDMPNLCWSGDMSATEILDENYNTVEVVAAWESGDDVYKLYNGDHLIGTFDNYYDAQEASRAESGDDIVIFCNGILC